MRLTALHTGIIVALMAVVVLTYAALTVDYYSWELEFSLWLQGFSLGRADSLREVLFWVGVREVSGVALLVVCVVLWLRRWRLEAIFVALVSVPDLLNILIKELIGRPRPTADMVEVVIGYGGIQGSGFPSGHAVHIVLFYGFLLLLARLYIPNQALVRTIFALGVRVHLGYWSVAHLRRSPLVGRRTWRLQLWRVLPAGADRGL